MRSVAVKRRVLASRSKRSRTFPWESLGRDWREMEVIGWGDDMMGWLLSVFYFASGFMF